MYPVSERWKKECESQIRQLPALVKVSLNVFDQQAGEYCEFSFSENHWNQQSDLLSGATNGGYASFEPNFFRVDGSQLVLPKENTTGIAKGVISKIQSNKTGVFVTAPWIQIHFSQPRSMVGLTFHFGRLPEESPKQLQIEIRDKQGRQQQFLLENPDPVHKLPLLLQDVVEIVVLFLQTKSAYGRARLEQIQFGIGYEFTQKEILQLSEHQSISPVTLELPRANLSFSVINQQGIFDADGDHAISQFLQKGQQIDLQYGIGFYPVAEWIPAGRWFLESWTSDGVQASFTAVNRMALLNKEIYEKAVYRWEWQNLYQVAENILQDAGLTPKEYWIDPFVKKFSSMAPIPLVSHGSALQIIANRVRAGLWVDRQGRVLMKYWDNKPVTTLPSDQIFEKPQVKRRKGLKSVTASWTLRSRYSNQRENLAQIRLKADGKWVRMEHKICLNPQVVTNPAMQVEATHYARVSYLRILGQGQEVDVTLQGDKLVEIAYPFEVVNQKEGEVLPLNNPLFDVETSVYVAEWMKEIYQKELQYQVELRGLTQLDVGDFIALWNGKLGQIIESRLEYAGAWKQSLIVMA